MNITNTTIMRFFTTAMVLSCFHLASIAETINGNNNGFSWSYDSNLKQLSIEGSGRLNEIVASEYQADALKLIIGEGITSIGSNALRNCTNLLEVDFPASLDTIYNYAFSRSDLGTIRCGNENPTVIYEHTFSVNSDLCVVFVPNGSKKFYAKASYWKDFDGIYQGDDKPDAITGSCGANVTYKLQPGDWVLTIQGNGEMQNGEIPWNDYCRYIYKVNIEDGISTICNKCCSSMKRLTSIEIPSSVYSIGDKAFYSCPITSVNFPTGLEKIGDYAFGQTSLETVNFPSSLQSIGESAFEYTKITSLVLPDSCTDIGKYAFSNCNELENAKLPESLRSIPQKLFYYCSKLSNVEIPSNLESIGASAFASTALTSIKIPSSVRDINAYAFNNCKSLKECQIDNGLDQIGYDAFAFCSSLEKINLPNSIRTILDEAFMGCGFSDITIPDSIVTVGENVFSGCRNLTKPVYNSSTFFYYPDMDNTEYAIPDGITKINHTAFRNRVKLQKVTLPQVESIGNKAFEECTALKEVVTGSVLKVIGGNAFNNCQSLDTFDLQNVETIGSGSFCNTSLTSLSIPNTVNYIGEGAFKDCVNLDGTVDLSNTSLTSLSNSVFSGCSKLDVVMLPSKLTTIGFYCFYGCEELESITNLSSVYSIGNYAFYSCKSLETIDLPRISYLGDYAFSNCINLREMDFKDGFSDLRNAVFENCEKLRKVVFPQSISVFDFYAFKGCNRLDSIYFHTEDVPQSLFGGTDYIGYGKEQEIDWASLPFDNCTILIPARSGWRWYVSGYQRNGNRSWEGFGQEFHFAEFYENLSGTCVSGKDSLFWSLDTKSGELIISGEGKMATNKNLDYPWQKRSLSIVSVKIEDGIQSVGNSAFMECSNIKDVKLPESLTEIGSSAFAGIPMCSMSINIPRSVTALGNNVFSRRSINKLYSHLIKPIASKDIFDDARVETIYIHKGTTELYKSLWGTPRKIENVNPTDYIELYVDVNVESNDKGQVSGSGEYEIGDSVILTATPNENCVFAGWSNGETANPYSFTASDDVTLEAIFKDKTHKVVFILDEDTVATYDVAVGGEITIPSITVPEGYTFSGWSEIPEVMPDSDVTVRGSLLINQYTITYMVDGEVYATSTVDYNSYITPPTPPDKEGYAFEWEEYPERMPAHDITISGKYVSTGIESVIADGDTENAKVFTVDGKQVNTPKKGINIIKSGDGTTKKIFVK